ncbi:MFS transporter [uncultured Sphingomonas sp.]|uniref:MFS transporter n=1 Tax=uncultured Sphingomonas sp. TaxID=158754 RepID=UPI0025DCCEB3|nr:MFS transporter [uncultured Sphingomonas sp.]
MRSPLSPSSLSRTGTAVAVGATGPARWREARLVAYSAGNFGKNLVFAGADATILFLLTDLFGLPGSVAGSLMLIALAGDLIFDLLAAALVIRLRRSGRGYCWLIGAGAVPGGAAFALLYAIPALGVQQTGILAGTLLAFRGAYAVIDVPHNAVMSQISSDSRARGRISGYRLFFSTVSSLIVASVLTPAVQLAAHQRTFGTLAAIGLVAGALFAATLIASALASPTDPAGSAVTVSDGLAIPVRDPLVLAMALLAIITGFAAPAFVRMLLHLTTYVIGRPTLAGSLLLAVTAGQFLGVLLWTALTSRYDKSVLLAAGHAVAAFGLILFAACPHSPPLLASCCMLIGVGLASIYMLPWGLLADVVDFVAWRHGRRFETGLFAAYLVVVKASGAGSTALIGWCLGWLGYMPGEVQSAAVRAGMLALGLGVPIAGCLAAVLLLPRFDIGHARHAGVIRALERRRPRPA